MRKILPVVCASPDCEAVTGHISRLCTTCRQRREAQFAAEDALGDAMASLHSPRGAELLALGRKEDALKPRLDLLVEGMPRALEEVAMVLTFGSQKYADHNWQHVDRAPQRYLAAGMRHELALATGETHDPETGAHHLAHKLCCDLFRLELALRGEEGDQ